MKGCPVCETEGHRPHGWQLRVADRCRRATEQARAYQRKYKATPSQKAYHRARRDKAWYGLTPQERLLLFEASDGLCAACYEEPATGVDHDHKTGVVRGALCRSCNLALGYLKDSEERILNLLAYLKESA